MAMKRNPQVAANLKQEHELKFKLAAGEVEATASIKSFPLNTFMMGA